MGNINLLISGNLTGFTNFFATSGAASLADGSGLDLDCRNFVSFLEAGDKAYAIEFTPEVIGVSLITRILDSFRRPGILVVAAVLPRRTTVRRAVRPDDKGALWQLLNSVYDRFCQYNMDGGMLRQNIALLMQDHYSDILAGYGTVPDPDARAVNIAPLPKNAGYVETTEHDAPTYLDTLYRRNYEGFHYVVLCPNLPQNERVIDEKPEEEKLYRVRIANSGRIITNVRADDRIPDIQPSAGEEDFGKAFTYRQVLDAEAGGRIAATVSGEEITLEYHFPQKEKRVSFRFFGPEGEIPFEQLLPKIETDGVLTPLPAATYTFRGREIEGQIYICIDGKYKSRQMIDLSRIADGGDCIVRVEQEFRFTCSLSMPYTGPAELTSPTHGLRKVRMADGRLDTSLPGRPADWTLTLSIEGYQPTSASVEELMNGQKLHLTKVVKPEEKRVIVRPDNPEKNKSPKLNIFKIGTIAVVTVLAVVLGIVGFRQCGNGEKGGTVVGTDTLTAGSMTTRTVQFVLQDASGDTIPKVLAAHWEEDDKLRLVITPGAEKVKGSALCYDIKAGQSSTNVQATVHFCNIIVSKALLSVQFNELQDTMTLELDVNKSEMKAYIDLINKEGNLSNKDYKEYKEKADGIKNSDFQQVFDDALESVKPNAPVQQATPQQRKEEAKPKADKKPDIKHKSEGPSEGVLRKMREGKPLGGSEKTQAPDYANWYNDVFMSQKSPEERAEITKELGKCSTYRAIEGVMNKYKGNK